MTEAEIEATVRAALRLAEKSVNYLPTVVGDASCLMWHVYIDQQKIGTIGEATFKRLEALRTELRAAHRPLSDLQVQEVSIVDKPPHPSHTIRRVVHYTDIEPEDT